MALCSVCLDKKAASELKMLACVHIVCSSCLLDLQPSVNHVICRDCNESVLITPVPGDAVVLAAPSEEPPVKRVRLSDDEDDDADDQTAYAIFYEHLECKYKRQSLRLRTGRNVVQRAIQQALAMRNQMLRRLQKHYFPRIAHFAEPAEAAQRDAQLTLEVKDFFQNATKRFHAVLEDIQPLEEALQRKQHLLERLVATRSFADLRRWYRVDTQLSLSDYLNDSTIAYEHCSLVNRDIDAFFYAFARRLAL